MSDAPVYSTAWMSDSAAARGASVTQMSAFNSNICSASNSPNQQYPVGFVRAKEDDTLMHELYARVDSRLRASCMTHVPSSEPRS